MRHADQAVVDNTNSVVGAAAYTSLPVSPQLPGISSALVGYLNAKKASGMSCVSSITVDTNAANTWSTTGVNTSTGVITTTTAHGWKTGLVGQCTTTGGLPGGLSTSTNYYVIVVSATQIKLASSYANALAGTFITLTTIGSGTGTFTPTALAGATVTPQFSLDGVTWANVASATNITVATVFSQTQDRPTWPYFRLAFAITSGSLSVSTTYYTYFEN